MLKAKTGYKALTNNLLRKNQLLTIKEENQIAANMRRYLKTFDRILMNQ